MGVDFSSGDTRRAIERVGRVIAAGRSTSARTLADEVQAVALEIAAGGTTRRRARNTAALLLVVNHIADAVDVELAKHGASLDWLELLRMIESAREELDDRERLDGPESG